MQWQGNDTKGEGAGSLCYRRNRELLEVSKERGSRLQNSQTAGLTFSLFKNVTELLGDWRNTEQGKKDLLQSHIVR